MGNPNDIGGTALAMTLFGRANRWGKLPYTLYPYEVMQSFNMTDYNMSTPPGRTYRYYTGETIFPFGYGLSLTEFNITCNMVVQDDPLHFICDVYNVGSLM